MQGSATDEVRALYQRLIDAWNNRNAREMAEQFTDKGELIGFDGSQAFGWVEIFSHLKPIFEDYSTPPFVS